MFYRKDLVALNQALLTNSLLESINGIFSGFFSSIDGTIYNLLDDILFINSTDFLTSEVNTLLGNSEKPRHNINL